MSTIKVDTIATRTGSGNITLSNNVASLTSAGAISGTNISASGTLAVTGTTTTAAITSTGRHDVNFNGSSTQAFKYTDTGGGNLASFGQFYNPSNALIANIQNANNAGVHMCLGTNGTVVFGNTGYTVGNALDEYEEGTFTPSVGGNATYNSQIGKYIIIGRSVTIKLEMHINVLGTGSTSTVTGIPYAADTEAPLAMGKAQNTNGSYGDITARLSGVTLYYMTRQGNVTAAATNTAIHANNFLIQVSGSYVTGS